VAFERAERETDPEKRAARLTFVIVGAGPTGVELAGTIAEMAHHTLPADFRNIDTHKARVVLIEAGPRVLAGFPDELSAYAQASLEKIGVEVVLGQAVTEINRDGVVFGGKLLEAKTRIWAAGVRASPAAEWLGAPSDRAGRVQVADDLTIPGHPEIFAIGDLTALEQDGRPVPGVAPAAMQMGRHAAASVLRSVRGEERRPFRYVDKGSLATIGRLAGVALFGRFKLWGFPAWAAWIAIHVFFLIGFRNRLVVMMEWALAYLTYQRNARIILVPRDLKPRRKTATPELSAGLDRRS